MAILKRFKMQKREQQKAQKVTLTTVEDETLNELEMPATEDEPLDNTFRQTVFNPKQTKPAKMMSIQVHVPERLATEIDCSSADSKPLESKISQRPGT